MSRKSLAWSLALSALLTAPRATTAAESQIPECGVASTYAVLKLVGRPVPLADLVGRFHEQCPEANLDALSIAELQKVLNSYSVYTQGLQVDVRNPKRLPCPAILYLPPDRLRNNQTGIGHFLVLASVSATEADVIDLSMRGGFSRSTLPLAELMKFWDGEMLAVSPVPFKSSGLPLWLIVANVLLLATAFAYVAWSERALLRQGLNRLLMRKVQRSAAAALLLGLLAAPAGCSRQQAVPGADAGDDAPLTIDEPEKNFVLPRALIPEATETFTLHTWGKGPVDITDVSSSCGCVSVTPDLIGSKLEPNANTKIAVRMRMNPGEPVRSVIVRFSTEPPGRKPVMLTLHGSSKSLPSVPPALSVDAPLGSRTSANVRVTYFRQKKDAKLALDPSRSALTPFRLEKSDFQSEAQTLTSNQGDPFVLDTLEMQFVLESPPALGTHQFKMRLAWEDDVPDSEIPVRVNVQHPLAPALSELFCGDMVAGQTLQRSVPLVAHGATKPRIRGVKALDPIVTPRLSDSGDALELNVTAPEKAGRFETVVILDYDPPTVPESRLRVAGLVSAKK
jgi:hypothetical protein